MAGRVILFGAGASYGSAGIVPVTPPLGNQLFSELVRRFPHSWGPLSRDTARRFHGNFELGMDQLWERAPEQVPTLMADMAEYFATFAPKAAGTTLYGKLARRLLERDALRDTVMSTLNYELVLDFEISALGIPVCYFEAPAPPGTASVLHLHGSCNFVPTSVLANAGVSYPNTRTKNDGLITALVSRAQVTQYLQSNRAEPPVMCIYKTKKLFRAVPHSMAGVQWTWKRCVEAADVVAVVGVHPNSRDAHIWAPLARTKAHLLCVGNARAFRAWAATYRGRRRRRVLASRFAESLDALTDWLSG